MPKIKTKSSAKKRFKITSKGKVISTQANKQHNMIKKSKRQLRNQRGLVILGKVESTRVKTYMPNNI